MSKIIKQCPYCGLDFETYDGYEDVFKEDFKVCCDKCKDIQQLKDIISSCQNIHSDKEFDNPINKAYREAHMLQNNDFEQRRVLERIVFKVENRSSAAENIIERLDFARQLLYTNIAAQFEILDSIYITKNKFWNELGKLYNYVHESSFEYVVIKLKELISGADSKYSVLKFRNIFKDSFDSIFGKQQITATYIYSNGDSIEILYDPFPIIEYLDKITIMQNEYSELTTALDDFRDKVCAHIDKLKNQGTPYNLTYANVKRIFNMLKIIYDGFLFAVAPDKYTPVFFQSNIWFSNMDYIVEKFKEFRNKQYEEILNKE
ncbi:MAG: hypothetical protein SPH55_02625 [Eubacteriales bacterium]|nr:hypothetical protein [Eubacteriales bacterium]MDY5190165.1 hypothetical protein [Eubacteriales bacterium]